MKTVFSFVCIALVLCVSNVNASIDGGSYYAPGSTIDAGDFVLGPTVPGKWGGGPYGTPGGVVTWSLMATGTSTGGEAPGTFTHLSAFMPAGFHAAVSAAFAAWSSIADITFVEVADNGLAFNAAGAVGDIRIGGHAFDGAGGVLAHGYFPPANGVSAAGDIHFDTGDLWKIGFGGPGFDIFQVMAHEIGHAIGLSHTAVPASLMNPFYTEAFAGPQADDIAGAQFIYGRRVTGVIPEPGTVVIWSILGVGLAVGRRRRAA